MSYKHPRYSIKMNDAQHQILEQVSGKPLYDWYDQACARLVDHYKQMNQTSRPVINYYVVTKNRAAGMCGSERRVGIWNIDIYIHIDMFLPQNQHRLREVLLHELTHGWVSWVYDNGQSPYTRRVAAHGTEFYRFGKALFGINLKRTLEEDLALTKTRRRTRYIYETEAGETCEFSKGQHEKMQKGIARYSLTRKNQKIEFDKRMFKEVIMK